VPLQWHWKRLGIGALHQAVCFFIYTFEGISTNFAWLLWWSLSNSLCQLLCLQGLPVSSPIIFSQQSFNFFGLGCRH
jgi:hypothetical protein